MSTGTAATPTGRLLDIEQAAAQLGISVRALRGVREGRKIQCKHVGKRLYFLCEALDAWAEADMEDPMRGSLAPAKPKPKPPKGRRPRA